MPLFTEEQKTKMVTGFNLAIEKYKDDLELVDILTEYRDDVLANEDVDRKS